jgi:hypothetical protein
MFDLPMVLLERTIHQTIMINTHRRASPFNVVLTTLGAGILWLTTVALVYAQPRQRGEIINVNYEYQIAFTDMGLPTLSKGDIVKAQLKDGQSLSLQVIQATEVLSKLVIYAPHSDSATQELFQTLSVGDFVFKVGRGAMPPTGVTAPVIEASPTLTLDPSGSVSTLAEPPPAQTSPQTSPPEPSTAPHTREKLDAMRLEYNELQTALNDTINEKQLLSQQVRDLKQQLSEQLAIVRSL